MHLRSKRLREAIVTSSAQDRILSAQRAMQHFERRAHVVVETANHARVHRKSDLAIGQKFAHRVKMRTAWIAEAIEDRGQLVDDRLVLRNFTVEHAQRVRLRAAPAIVTHPIGHTAKLLAQAGDILRTAIRITHGVDAEARNR